MLAATLARGASRGSPSSAGGGPEPKSRSSGITSTAPPAPQGQTPADGAERRAPAANPATCSRDLATACTRIRPSSLAAPTATAATAMSLERSGCSATRRNTSAAMDAGACAAALPAVLALSRPSANPQRTYTLLNRGEPGIRALHESVGLSRGARILRRLPSRTSSRPRLAACTQPAPCSGAARHTTTAFWPSRTISWANPTVAMASARGSWARRCVDPEGRIRCRHPAAAVPAAGLGNGEARRYLPDLRARRPQHRQPLSRNRTARRAGQTRSVLEEPGRPDFRQSNRGPGTGARIAVPVINITKTRLNDPSSLVHGNQ